MKGIYEQVVQPSALVVFSSLPISGPLEQISMTIDGQLGADSFIALLDDATHELCRHADRPLIYHHRSYTPPDYLQTPPSNLLGTHQPARPIRSPVLHIQSPNCKNTFVTLPPLASHPHHNPSLGISLPFLHLQIKPLDHTFLIQVGVRDQAGDQILIRCSTFQTETKSYVDPKSGAAKLIHVPLTFPRPSETKWCELMVPLARLMPTKYRSTDFISVHANIRLRRIYFTSDGKIENLQTRSAGPDGPISSHSIFRPELMLFKAASPPPNQPSE